MADTDKLINNFAFLYFLKMFLTCRLFTPEGEEGSDVIYQYRVDFYQTNIYCLLHFHGVVRYKLNTYSSICSSHT